jgi:hypothetical protein
MKGYSTRQVAKKLGLGEATLSRYIAAKKIPAPETIQAGDMQHNRCPAEFQISTSVTSANYLSRSGGQELPRGASASCS